MKKIITINLERFVSIFKARNNLNKRTHFEFSSDNRSTSFFKKRPTNTPQIVNKEQTQSKLIKQKYAIEVQIEDISSILNDYDRYFHQQRQALPSYLHRLSKLINEKCFLQYRELFDAIYYKINKYSSQLVLKSHQLLQIMIFLEKYLHFSSKFGAGEALVVNNGFEHRATMLAATFLYNGEFSLTQAIAIYQILMKIGSISMLFTVNLTKVIKTEFNLQNAKDKVKLQHIITILSTYLLNNNHTVLQNVLCDIALNYLLKNDYLTNSIPLTFRIEIISMLLRFDLRYFYLSEKQQLNQLLHRQIHELLQLIDKQLHNLDNKSKELSYGVELIQNCDLFMMRNSNSQIHIKIKVLVQSLYGAFFRSFKQTDNFDKMFNQYLPLYMRLIFNRQFFQVSLSFQNKRLIFEKIQKAIKQIKVIKQETFVAPVALYYACEKAKQTIVAYLRQVYTTMLEKSLFFPSVIKIIIQNAHQSKIVHISHQLSTLYQNNQSSFSQKNWLCLHYLIFLANTKTSDALKDQKIIKLEQKLRSQIKELVSSKMKFIKALSEATKIFQYDDSRSAWFKNILKGVKLHHHLYITHPNQFERNQHEKDYINIITQLESEYFNEQLVFHQNFNEHIIYAYLRSLYPEHNSKKNVFKNIKFLQNDATFSKNVKIIIALAGKIEKYSYLIWDIFINNYINRSQDVRVASFALLKQLFLNAYSKQAGRKVVLLAMLSNYLSSGLVLAPKKDLKQLFEECLLPLVQENIKEKFHYHCFLQITFNAKSIGILSEQSFSKIINRCLNAARTDINSFRTSLLLLLYGMTMRNSEKNVYIDQFQQQIKYLQILLNNKLIAIINNRQHKQVKTGSGLNKKTVIAGSKYICVLLSSGLKQILKISEQIIQFVEHCDDFCDFMMILHSFTIDSYNLEIVEIREFILALNQAFFIKLDHIYKQQLLNKIDYDHQISAINKTIQKMNDYSK